MKIHLVFLILTTSIALYGCSDEGTEGKDGTDGIDGLNTLEILTQEPGGDNCIDGGWKIDSGLDDDGDGILDNEEIDSTSFECNNSIPVAKAGYDKAVLVGSEVLLDGQNSTDGDGDMLEYNWNMILKPTGSSAVLSFDDVVNPSFYADVEGTYIVALRVDDIGLSSVQDTITIEAFTPSFPIPNAGSNQLFTVNDVGNDGLSSNDVVIDDVTGLEWERVNASAELTWSEAGTYCGDLSLGGFDDWRLPTVKELFQIVNLSGGSSIISSIFPNTASSLYWSSTAYYDIDRPWYVSFVDGSVDKDNHYHSNRVRCVRGTQQLNIELFDTFHTIVDINTGLEWQKNVKGGDWYSATSYCEDLTLTDNDDWRLPTTKELQSIVDYTRYGPAIDQEFFPDTSWIYLSGYWSSGHTNNYPWLVSFGAGRIKPTFDKYENNYSRCVRNIQ
ncbi:MAG: DUF1566 domain-containing protein [Proteobacteria bacterium]|nr:DUF1566 domain-containing protein [Pseudomonadota bacterium]